VNRDGYVDVERNVTWCRASWFTAVFSITLLFGGLMLISYYPWKMMNDSLEGKMRQETVTKKTYATVIGGAFFFAVLWFAVGMADGLVGSFRGLYCGATTWQSVQGVFLFGYAIISFCVMIYFYYGAWKMLRSASSNSAGTSTKSIETAAANVMKFGVIMVVSFLVTWGVLTICCLLSVLGVATPIQLESKWLEERADS
jgi:hypothetical protein